jgi:dTDP-4-dehydrorhamnose reductase
MRILMFGKTGQVAQEILRLDPSVYALSRHEADFTDPEGCAALVKNVDVVINAVAYTAVDKAETDVENAYLVNEKTPEAIAKACKVPGIPLIHISTDYVFDGAQQAYTEDDPTNPLSVYGKSKLAGEQAIARMLPEHVIIRTARVFSELTENFATKLRQSDNKVFKIIDNQFSGPTPAIDLAKAVLKIAKDPHTFGVFHYNGEPGVTRDDFARVLLADKDSEVQSVPPETFPTPAERPNASHLICDKIKRVYNIDTPDWQAYVKDMK